MTAGIWNKRPIGLRWLISLSLAQMLGGQPWAASQQSTSIGSAVEEPIFGLWFYSNQVNFDSIESSSVATVCKQALADIKPLPRKLTLYGRYETKAATLLIVGAADNQKLLAIRGQKCELGVPSVSMGQLHHNPPIPGDGAVLSDAEVTGLFADVIDRYVQALGGKKAFFEWLDRLSEHLRVNPDCQRYGGTSCPSTYHDFQPELQKIIEQRRSAS